MIVHLISNFTYVQSLLWAQMIGRAFSALLHSNMRSMPPSRTPADYHGLVANHLNLLLGIPFFFEIITMVSPLFLFLLSTIDVTLKVLESKVKHSGGTN